MSEKAAAAPAAKDRLSVLATAVHVPDSPILSAADTARLMGFPTREVLAKARRTGRLPIEMFLLEGRRGWFARRDNVISWLESALSHPASPQ